jgi:predicted nucleic acid-binding protein
VIPITAVFDASALVRAVGEERDYAARSWLRAAGDGRVRAHVPDLAYVEAASAFRTYVRGGTITDEEADERLTQIVAAPLEAIPLRLLCRQALAFARLRGLSAYDACYLALAIGLDATLVTADRRLAAEAEKVAFLPTDHPPT